MNQINLKPLKIFAKKKLHDYPILQRLLLEEAEKIDSSEFSMKVGIWTRLFEIEKEKGTDANGRKNI
jgi:hypothetical protein